MQSYFLRTLVFYNLIFLKKIYFEIPVDCLKKVYITLNYAHYVCWLFIKVGIF